MRFVIWYATLFLIAVTPGPRTPAAAELKPLTVNFMLRGYCFAGSSIEDTSAPGGFWESDNTPRPIRARFDSYQNAIFLVIDTSTIAPFQEEYRGLNLYLLNATDTVVRFGAADSRLPVVQQALDSDGMWKPIEYLPSSWCGNSYHYVFLGANECWRFCAPKYFGARKTRIRFALRMRDTTIYSNEYIGGVNPDQFQVRQGHIPSNIMDPYLE